MLENVVFPHGFYSQQLPAGPRGRNELAGGVASNPVDSVDQKSVGFLPLARHRETGPTVALSDIRGVIGNADVECQKLIEAAPVQRQVLDLLLGDQS